MRTRRTYVKTDGFGQVVKPEKGPRDVASERAARGAALLDREIPGWADHIGLDRLDVGEGEMSDHTGTDDSLGCILCQLDQGIVHGKLCAPRAAPVLYSGSDAASDRLDDYTERERYAEQRARETSDAIEEERADILDLDDSGPTGDYDRLAVQLGLVFIDGLSGHRNESAKVSHGLLADSKTTYPLLDDAWTREIKDRTSTARL